MIPRACGCRSRVACRVIVISIFFIVIILLGDIFMLAKLIRHPLIGSISPRRRAYVKMTRSSRISLFSFPLALTFCTV